MPITAILFDMDETLVVDDAAAEEAMLATCQRAAPQYGVEATVLSDAVRRYARELWRASPVHGYGRAMGISSWEALWGRFLGDDPNITALREWAPGYRREAWSWALVELGVRDTADAERWSAMFQQERRARHRVFPDAEPCLMELKQHYRLALLSNGAPDLQREKLEASGLGGYFETVVISGEVGIGKPEPGIFLLVLERLGVSPQAAVMGGDSRARDIQGAQRAGIRAIWLNRTGVAPSDGVVPDAQIRSLAELSALLAGQEVN